MSFSFFIVKRSDSISCFLQTSIARFRGAAEAKAAEVVAGGGAAPAAERRAAEPCVAEPAPAAQHADIARCRSFGIVLIAIVAPIPILAPLPHIAVHVMEPPCIGRIRSNVGRLLTMTPLDRRSTWVSAVAVRHVAVERAAPAVGRRGPRATCIFPFRLSE